MPWEQALRANFYQLGCTVSLLTRIVIRQRPRFRCYDVSKVPVSKLINNADTTMRGCCILVLDEIVSNFSIFSTIRTSHNKSTTMYDLWRWIDEHVVPAKGHFGIGIGNGSANGGWSEQ
jgi:hypothetical protein